MLPVPQFEFGSFKYAAGLTNYNDYWKWSGPSRAIQSMALRVMTAGEVLPVTPPAPNSTWTLDFWGPALQCDNVPETKKDEIFTNIWNSYYTHDLDPDPASYGFLSWVPWSPVDYGENENFSVDQTNPAPYLPFMFDFLQVYSGADYGGVEHVPKMGPPSSTVSTDAPLSLFMAVLPGTQSVNVHKTYPGPNAAGATDSFTDVVSSMPGNSGTCPYRNISHVTDTIADCQPAELKNIVALAFEGATLLQCDLVNTSYSSEFEYSNGQQSIRLKSNTMRNSPVVNGSAQFIGPGKDSPESINCGIFRADGPAYSSIEEAPKVSKNCDFDLSALHLLSYQGIMAAFNQLIVGSSQRSTKGNTETNTTIMRTVLAGTSELAFMRDWHTSYATVDSSSAGTDTLQTLVANSTGKVFQGLTGEEMLGTRGTLKSTLEELFRNYTISLLAEPYFQ